MFFDISGSTTQIRHGDLSRKENTFRKLKCIFFTKKKSVFSRTKNKKGAEAVKSKSNTNTEALAGTPSPNLNDQDNDDKNEKKYEKQSAKDAKKLDDKGAETFSKERGYKDAHDLKRDYLKGQKDTTEGHYDIKVNKKTGEAFLVNKSGTVTVIIE